MRSYPALRLLSRVVDITALFFDCSGAYRGAQRRSRGTFTESYLLHVDSLTLSTDLPVLVSTTVYKWTHSGATA